MFRLLRLEFEKSLSEEKAKHESHIAAEKDKFESDTRAIWSRHRAECDQLQQALLQERARSEAEANGLVQKHRAEVESLTEAAEEDRFKFEETCEIIRAEAEAERLVRSKTILFFLFPY